MNKNYLIILIIMSVAIFTGVYLFSQQTIQQQETQTQDEQQVIVGEAEEALPTDPDAALLEIVKQSIIQKQGDTAADITVSLTEQLGDYAKGMVNSDGGGGIWFASKANGAWKLVWDGNGIICCDELSEYPDFPAKLIPQCLDNSGNLKTR